VDVGLDFSLKSVIITVKSPTVTSRCWALLRSMFFNRGLGGGGGQKKGKKIDRKLAWYGYLLNMMSDFAIFLFWKHASITSSFYGFSFYVLALCHSCLSQIFPSSPFWGAWGVQTADSLAVQPAEKQAVVFWKETNSHWPHSWFHITEHLRRVSMWFAQLPCATVQFDLEEHWKYSKEHFFGQQKWFVIKSVSMATRLVF